jgi:hypothetical protein
MNWLSWLLYLAEVLSNIGTFFATIGATIAIFMIIAFVVALNELSGGYPDDWAELLPRKLLKWSWVPFLLLTISIMIPSRDTFYAIAASEVGEEAINTPTFNKARTALNRWLDRQMASTKEEANK